MFFKKIVFLKNKILIIENSDDINFLKKYNLKHQIVFIKGSGVDLKKFKPGKFKKKISNIAIQGIKEKGITEFILAADILKEPQWHFQIVGAKIIQTIFLFKKKLLDLNKNESVILGYEKYLKYYKCINSLLTFIQEDI